MMRPSYYLYALVIVMLVGALIGIFRGSLFNRLSTRIIIIILISAPLSAILLPISTRVLIHFGVIEAPGSLSAAAFYVLFALSVPLVLGLLAAHFVRRPLHEFSETVTSLKQSNYKVQLKSTGIGEFDEVFVEFNDLIQRLQHEEKLRKDLISDTSHELNTPLTTMIGQLTAMQEGKLPMTKERVGVLKEQAERLADLVQQLDAYTKARSPDNIKPEDILLLPFCQEIFSQFSLELKQKGITPKLEIADGYMIHANHRVLHRIMTNLVQNALRYSEADEIVIKAGEGKLTFSDNGKGVPTESLPYLFERFYRVDRSRNRATGGLGLGLAIVKELAESQGWTVTAKDGRPGLKFTISLADTAHYIA